MKGETNGQTSRLLPSLSSLIRRNNSTADIDIGDLANMLKSFEPTVAHPLI